MNAPHQKGWRVLAEYLRALNEARWAGLPPEAAAEEAWPSFQEAVIVALREGRALRGPATDKLGGGLTLQDPAGPAPASVGSHA